MNSRCVPPLAPGASRTSGDTWNEKGGLRGCQKLLRSDLGVAQAPLSVPSSAGRAWALTRVRVPQRRFSRSLYDAALAVRAPPRVASHSSASGVKKLMRAFLYSLVGYSARFSFTPTSRAMSLMIDSHSSMERP